MTNASTQTKPATVSETAKQAGEVRARWAWVEATVWTERMLMALEKGVKGGVWFSLMDKVERPAESLTDSALAARQESTKADGHPPCQDAASLRREPADDHCSTQSNAARVV